MVVKNQDILKDGFVDAKIDKSIDIVGEINALRKEKNAIILAHFYQEEDIQDIADFVGDSLALSQQAAKTKAKMIVFAGVHFMAETAKILSPDKKVLLPDLNAGCSLAESCPHEEFAVFKEKYPEHIVVSYVNATAEIKTLSDIVCTSSNAVKIVESIPKEKKIIFAPDKNLGKYISRITGRKMVIWDGGCHVHEAFSLERILETKKKYQDAKLIAHPECDEKILNIADHIGSTASLLEFTTKDPSDEYIVATDSGIIYQMKKKVPDKHFIPAPPEDRSCDRSDCNFMKTITVEKIYNTLRYEIPEIILDEEIRRRAEKPILRMMEISEKFEL